MAKAYLVKSKEKRVEYGHPWIFKSDIEKIDGDFIGGDVVDVYSSKNKFLGKGFINPKSQITIRMLTYEDESIDYGFLYKRISDAWEYRKKVADPLSCRVVFAESDFLPALIVDKFSDYLVVQTLALGIDRYKEQIVDILNDIIKPAGIFERNDVPVRELEGLDQKKGYLSKEFNTKVLMVENGVKFNVDLENGQKTGFFLDQKENRASIKPFVKDAKVLDCFCHTGSFALHAGYYNAKSVLGIDISEHASQFAYENASLNGLENVCRFETANTFDKLREFYDNKERFDTIVLDPPAFTKTKGAVEGAVRGYKEINLRAMKIIESGGYLITCSCSHHVDPDLFMDIIYSSAIDAKRKVRLVEYRTQAKDHPILLASPETQYLKCAILQIV
ncbi:class I SAM-dependent rRNA methyltransferase [Pseudobacteroides cellulosolvens]|uniref:S-adenosylmethionine-dependent methyltransferase n=1 Tax=Pseudobacteroides cellulosolvens ATCC 35603 = DSM 2933 TaxID=398512 RepID=A0A0L6JLI2_9FIRM|nr:class I SAM-dependent rRNA methyltransferase [Pseudobacteroides cellulosolvens]KNY26615.1 S-adenosylmethionine-dependent methyltransferase [Pseudobacteroides cellulosolvens ATCC 35603 = DSM 2933]